LAALEAGRFDAEFLSRFDRDFRSYFDPSMLYLGLCAVILRNRHFQEFWMRSTYRGFQAAQADPDFGRVAGTTFGGLNLQPLAVLGQVWRNIFAYLAEGGTQAIRGLMTGRGPTDGGLFGDLAAWERGWRQSIADDPAWHFHWLGDVAKAMARVQPLLGGSANPRTLGPLI
jgi:hypothetical protein